jgi:methylenetetrahydrofolate dehydrogenase (NADP+)/methenyltetrahydrofolate cyclohydrolase
VKILNGRELADYIKARQAHQVRSLRQAAGITPRLAIVQTIDDAAIDTYVRLKKAYGADILAEVDVYKIPQAEALTQIAKLNQDDAVHGMIVQLPLEDPTQTTPIVNAVAASKDVDGLGAQPDFDPATPMAINWLLAGYNVELRGKVIAIVGQGRLVGAPLARMWRASGFDVTILDSSTDDLGHELLRADVIVSATGVPGLVTSDMVKIGATVVDAGTASENGKLVGDIAADVRARGDLTITPEKGGVGPLTITALMDNVIRAARARAAATT